MTRPVPDALRRAKHRAGQARAEALRLVWRASGEGRANQRRLAALAGRYRGRRCVVMGNGPSLLAHDLDRLRDEVTIVSNAHYLIWGDLSYVPTFLTVEDVLVAEDRAGELRGLNGITKVFPHDLNHLLGPASEDTMFVNFRREYEPFPQFSRDITRRAFWGGTVSVLNLQLARFLGCNPIVLIGFDHSYVVPEKPSEAHVIHSDQADVNHIHPDYFGPGYRWHDPNVARMEAGYRGAHAALKADGVEVLNATAGGHLEVFPRASFDSLFGST